MSPTPKSTFFWRLLIALDAGAIESLCIEAGVDRIGMSALDMRYAIAAADDNGKGENSNAIRLWMHDYVRMVLL